LAISLGPPAAVAAGAAWQYLGETNLWHTNNWQAECDSLGLRTVVFREMPGWCAPTNQVLNLVVGSNATAYGGYGVPARLQVNLEPASALAAGAGWRLANETNYRSASDYEQCFAGAVTVQFKPLGGWQAPTYRAVTLMVGQTNVVAGIYQVNPPVMQYAAGTGLVIQGTLGTTYVIEQSPSLSLAWTTHTTVTLSGSSATVPGTAPSATGARFYRARWVP
jgi:hypothetical protein